ncbi:unknown [Prevotella sp. CAG:487]|nr:unknown [Prevotella sp. CAG:487]
MTVSWQRSVSPSPTVMHCLCEKLALCCQNSDVKWNLMCLKSCCAMLST